MRTQLVGQSPKQPFLPAFFFFLAGSTEALTRAAARSPSPRLAPSASRPTHARATRACAAPGGRLTVRNGCPAAAMAPSTCRRVAAVSCLVLCVSLLLPRTFLSRGGGGRQEPGAAPLAAPAPPEGKRPPPAALRRSRAAPGLAAAGTRLCAPRGAARREVSRRPLWRRGAVILPCALWAASVRADDAAE